MQDEKKPRSGNGKKRINRKKMLLIRRALAAAVTVVVIIAAVMVFYYRDSLTSEGIRNALGGKAEQELSEDFTYETGGNQAFAPVGNGAAVVSGSSMQLLNHEGNTVVKELCSFSVPAVAGSESSAVFYDVGGGDCYAADLEGNFSCIQSGGDIYSVSVNSSGYIAVVSDEAGYKGLVSVYDAAWELVYQWYSGTGYVLGARISPDNRYLAALCATEDGSAIRVFPLNKESEHAAISFPGELIYDMDFVSAETVAAVGENRMVFAGIGGKILGEYSFGENYLCDYSIGSGDFSALYLSRYRSGAGGTIVSLDEDGRVLGTAETERSITSLSANGKGLVVMTSGDIKLYDENMKLRESSQELMTAKRAFLLPGGDILLMSSSSADFYDF